MQRGLYTEQLLHTDAFTQRCTEQLLHTDPPGFYAQKVLQYNVLHISFAQTSFYTEKPLHRASFIHRSIYLHIHTHKSFTDTPLRTELLHTDAFTHRSLFTEQGLHRAAFTHRSFYTERVLCTEQLIQSYAHRNFKHANAQASTQTGLYT